MTRARPFPLVVLTLALALAWGAGARAAGTDPALWRGDARVLAAAVDSLHPRPWRHVRKAAFDSAAAALDRSLPGLRYDQAVAGFSRLLAMLGDGHTRLDQLDLPSHGRPVLTPLPGPGFRADYPVDFEVFADGLRIVRATAAHADLPGARVLAVNGRPVAGALAALAPLIPADNAMWTLRMLPVFLRSPGYLAAAGLGDGPSAPLRLTLAGAGGRTREAALVAEPPDTAARWIEADADVRTPLPLARSLAGPLAFADLGDSARTVFVRIRAIVNPSGPGSMAAFVARLFAHVDSAGARRLVLDLWGNGGGDNYLDQPLVHAVIRRPALDRTGGLFVVVDRGTFSAAVSLAADLERETHALFVGEPTGAAPNSPGDPRDVTLPGSGLVARVSTVFWQGSDPRDPRGFIAPDLPAMATWADWIGHRDPALEAIAAWRPDPGARETPPNTHWAGPARLHATAPRIAW